MTACTKTSDITNHGRQPVRFNLEVMIRSDFADVFDVKSKRAHYPALVTNPKLDLVRMVKTLTTTYRNEDFVRAVMIAIQPSRTTGGLRETAQASQLRGQTHAPGESWHACLLVYVHRR